MAAIDPDLYEFHPDDAHRMRRLSEEVRGRLHEMGLITARTVGRDPSDGTVAKFVPHAREDDAGTTDWMEIVDVELDDGTVVQACYGEIGGVCFARSPC